MGIRLHRPDGQGHQADAEEAAEGDGEAEDQDEDEGSGEGEEDGEDALDPATIVLRHLSRGELADDCLSVGWYDPLDDAMEVTSVCGRDELELEEVPAGEVLVFAEGVDTPLVWVERVFLAPGETRTLYVRPDRAPTPIEIAGRVVDPEGRPLAFVAVAAEASGPMGDVARFRLARNGIETEADGTFVLSLPEEGRYRLRASVGPSDVGATEVHVRDGSRVELRTQPVPLVSCRARDPRGGYIPFVPYLYWAHSEGSQELVGVSYDRRRVDEVHFVWPEAAESVEVVALVGWYRRIQVDVEAPGDPCVLPVPAPEDEE